MPAGWSTTKAGYVFTVKKNQPRLYRQLKALPWAKIPIQDETSDRGHGRYDIRRLQAVACTGALALDFPHAVQAPRIRRGDHPGRCAAGREREHRERSRRPAKPLVAVAAQPGVHALTGHPDQCGTDRRR
jgi:hypothetical protein